MATAKNSLVISSRKSSDDSKIFLNYSSIPIYLLYITRPHRSIINMESKAIIATTAIAGAAIASVASYLNDPKQTETTQVGFVDPKHDEELYLYENDAMHRAERIKDISYKLAISLLTGGEDFEGNVIIEFDISQVTRDVFVDFKGRRVYELRLNDKVVTQDDFYRDHRIYLPK